MSSALGLSIGCDFVILRMLADPWPDDQQADALETSYPLGEVQAIDLYGTRNLNSLTAQELGTKTKRWVEKILSNGGLSNSSAWIVVATPSLLHKESERNIIQQLNTIKNITVLRSHTRSSIVPLSIAPFHKLTCISVFLDSMGCELTYYENDDGVYESLRSFNAKPSEKLLSDPKEFIEHVRESLNRNLSDKDKTPLDRCGVDKVMAYAADPDKQQLLDALCSLKKEKSKALMSMDKGYVAAACCIESGILAGKIKDRLLLKGIQYYIFCKALDAFGNPSNQKKIIHRDATIPVKSSISIPKISEGSSLEVYASHDPDGNDHFFSIQSLSTHSLFTRSTCSPGIIEVDVDANGLINVQLMSSSEPSKSIPTTPSQQPEKSDIQTQNRNIETTKRRPPKWLRPAKHDPKLAHKINLFLLVFSSVVTVASVMESSKIAQLPWRKQCTEATINRSNCPEDKPNMAAAIVAMFCLYNVASYKNEEKN